MEKRDVSKTKRQAVLNVWDNKCAISGIESSIDVDHIISLYNGGSNEFINLVPVAKRINRQKNKGAYPKPLEDWLLFQAANKAPACSVEYARLSHKTNPLPKDPSKIDIEFAKQYLMPSKNWSFRELVSLLRAWVKYGIRRLREFATRVGKSIHSARMKLVHLGIYNNAYQGI